MINLRKKKEQTKPATIGTADRAAALQNIDALKGEAERKKGELEKQRVAAHALAQKKRVEFENARKNFVEAESQHSKLMYQLDNLGFQTDCSINRISAALVRGCSPLVEEFHAEMLDRLQATQRQEPETVERRLGQNINTGTVMYKQFSNQDQICTATARIVEIVQHEINALRLAADQTPEALEPEFQRLRDSIPTISSPKFSAVA